MPSMWATTHRKRFFLLIFIMLAVTSCVGLITLLALYHAAFEQGRERLIQIARGQARLIEAVARFDAQFSSEDLPAGAFAATLSQITEAHARFEGFGETGEFTLAKLEDDQIVFLLSRRHQSLQTRESIPISSTLAEPMRRALAGEWGSLVGLDYRGEMVLAAYEPVRQLEVGEVGIVAKIDLAEIQAPFINAGLLAGAAGLVLVLAGTLLSLRIGKPLVQQSEESERKYRTLFERSTEAVFLLSASGVIEDCNLQACRLWACGRDDIIGHSALDFAPATQPDGRESATAARERIEAALSGRPQFFYWKHRRKDGVLIDVEISNGAVEHGGRQMLLATVRDITERKRAEQALRSSEVRYRNLFEDSPFSLWEEDFSQVKKQIDDWRKSGIKDFETYFKEHPEAVKRCAALAKVIDVNRQTVELFETGNKGALLKGLPTFFIPESYDAFRKELIAVSRGETRSETETVTWTRSGKRKYLAVRWSVVPGYAATLTRVIVSMIDITERKRAEEEIKAHTRRQAAVAELGQAALTTTDLSRLMDRTVTIVAETLGVEYGKILELLPDGKALLLRAGVGWQEGLVGQATVGTGEDSQAGFTLLSDEPVVVEELRREKRFSRPPLLRDHGVVSGMSVIIRGHERPFGVLGAHTTRRRTFSKDAVYFLRSVANGVADAIERKRSEEGRAQLFLREQTAWQAAKAEAKFRHLLEAAPDG
ncbi:MAG: PAS domain S-box protein, partial [Terriglobia bacterium]